MHTDKPQITQELIDYAYKLAALNLDPAIFPIDEARSAALVGLAKAWQRFDPTRGVKFTTFAYIYIRNEVLMAIRSHKSMTAAESLYAAQAKPTVSQVDRYELDELGLPHPQFCDITDNSSFEETINRKLDTLKFFDWAQKNLPEHYYTAIADTVTARKEKNPKQLRYIRRKVLEKANGTFRSNWR